MMYLNDIDAKLLIEYSELSDRNKDFEVKALDVIFRNRLHSVMLAEEFEGKSLNIIEMCEKITEISSLCHYTGLILAMHHYTIGALRENPRANSFLNNVIKENALFASISDPHIEADFNRAQTKSAIGITYEKRPGKYIINGSKKFVSGARLIRYLPIYAYNEDLDNHFPVSVFLIDMKSVGVQIQKNSWCSNSMNPTETYDVTFDNVVVKDSNLISSEGKGIEETTEYLYWFRLALSAVYLGICKSAYNHILEYVKSKPYLRTNQSAQQKLSAVKINYELARSQLYRSSVNAEDERIKGHFTKDLLNQTMITKYFISNTVNEILDQCVKLKGIVSLNNGDFLERLSRDAKASYFHPPQDHIILQQIALNELGIIKINRKNK